jgi:hypothetical protein
MGRNVKIGIRLNTFSRGLLVNESNKWRLINVIHMFGVFIVLDIFA